MRSTFEYPGYEVARTAHVRAVLTGATQPEFNLEQGSAL